MLPEPSDLFLECLKNPEPLIDKAYCNDELIISKGRDCQPTEIMKTHTQVIERICAAKIAKSENQTDNYLKHIQALDQNLIGSEYAQFLELTSFFPVMDMSFSAYKKLKLSQRLKTLESIIGYYLDCRQDVYMSHGYTAVTIQARKDFEKHKRQGGFAKQKIKTISENLGYRSTIQGKTIEDSKGVYCFIDQKLGKTSLRRLEKRGESWHKKWSKRHEGKQADILFSGHEQYFICEAKHVKESGGGQDKQINELITFIDSEFCKQQPKNIFYIAFLDGVYFNKFREKNPPAKVKTQRERIEKCLRKPKKRSFFVNTYGLKKLLAEAIKRV